MKNSSKLFNRILLAALGLSAVLFFVLLFAGLSVLASKSSQLTDLKVQSETADAQLSNLEQTKKDVEKYSYFKTVAKTVIPSDKDQAAAVFEINQMATRAGFKLQSITFPTSSLGGDTTTTTTSGSGAASKTTSSSASTSTRNLSQAKPVQGIAGLYSLQLIITSDTSKTLPDSEMCTYPKILNFLDQIEKNRRTAQITDVSITPASDSAALNLSLTINIFIKP